MLRFFSRHFLTGLVTVLPIAITFYLLYWFAVSAEALLGTVLRALLPEHYYWPGMGLIAALLGVFLVGLLLHLYVVRLVFSKSEQLLYRMPVIKTIYKAFRDFFDFFSTNARHDFKQVVAVSLGDSDMQLVGFITQPLDQQLPQGLKPADATEPHVLVYLPMSYMIGGYAVLVPKRQVRPLSMSLEQAMRFTLTAGVAGVAGVEPSSQTEPPKRRQP